MSNKETSTDVKSLNVMHKLLYVQKKLKAPKNQRNNFGEYNYRSCEDILEAVKPLLDEVGATIVLSDDISIFGDRFYVKATACFMDCDTDAKISSTAFAREVLEKKKSDPSQCTGAASSYARKYALNGLLLIDDTKDLDGDTPSKREKKPVDNTPINQEQMEHIKRVLVDHCWNQSAILEYYHVEGLSAMTKSMYEDLISRAEAKK